MEFSLRENIPGLMIFITFHKAFDTLEWSFLVSCLNSFFLLVWSRLYSLIQDCTTALVVIEGHFNPRYGFPAY